MEVRDVLDDLPEGSWLYDILHSTSIRVVVTTVERMCGPWLISRQFRLVLSARIAAGELATIGIDEADLVDRGDQSGRPLFRELGNTITSLIAHAGATDSPDRRPAVLLVSGTASHAKGHAMVSSVLERRRAWTVRRPCIRLNLRIVVARVSSFGIGARVGKSRARQPRMVNFLYVALSQIGLLNFATSGDKDDGDSEEGKCDGKEDELALGIVLVQFTKHIPAVAQILEGDGGALPFHGNEKELSRSEKEDNMRRWMRGEVKWLVGTSAIGRGVDNPNVRYIIHLKLPRNIETYLQEIGRAGRDGHISLCVLVWHISMLCDLLQLVDCSEESAQLECIREMMEFSMTQSECRVRFIANIMDEVHNCVLPEGTTTGSFTCCDVCKDGARGDIVDASGKAKILFNFIDQRAAMGEHVAVSRVVAFDGLGLSSLTRAEAHELLTLLIVRRHVSIRPCTIDDNKNTSQYRHRGKQWILIPTAKTRQFLLRHPGEGVAGFEFQ